MLPLPRAATFIAARRAGAAEPRAAPFRRQHYFTPRQRACCRRCTPRFARATMLPMPQERLCDAARCCAALRAMRFAAACAGRPPPPSPSCVSPPPARSRSWSPSPTSCRLRHRMRLTGFAGGRSDRYSATAPRAATPFSFAADCQPFVRRAANKPCHRRRRFAPAPASERFRDTSRMIYAGSATCATQERNSTLRCVPQVCGIIG